MLDVLQALSETSDVEFEKCGEIIVAPKRGVYALACHHCQDIFMQMPEFMRHMRSRHHDVLEFSKNKNATNVYTIDELMNGREESNVSSTDDETDLWNSDAEENIVEEDSSDEEECASVVDKVASAAGNDEENVEENEKEMEKEDKETEDKEKEDKEKEDKEKANNEEEEKDQENNEKEEKEDYLNMSILRALEECDVEPELRNGVELKAAKVTNKPNTKRVAEELPNVHNLNLTAFLDHLESNDLTEINLEQLEDMQILPQSKRPRIETQKEADIQEIQKSPFKSKSKDLEEARNLDVQNLQKLGYLIQSQIHNKKQLEEVKKQLEELQAKSPTASNETHIKTQSQIQNKIIDHKSPPAKIETNVAETQKTPLKPELNTQVASPTTAKTNKPKEVEAKGRPKSKLKNLFDFLDGDCCELDNILDSLEDSGSDLNVGELEAELQHNLLEEDKAAFDENVRETIMAEEESLKRAVDEDDFKMRNTSNLANLSLLLELDSKAETNNTSILKQTVESQLNRSLAEVESSIKNKPKQPKISELLPAFSRTLRKPHETKQDKENSENCSPSSDEQKVKNVMVKVQRLSPEVIAQTVSGDSPQPRDRRADTPLKKTKSNKQTFKSAKDAKRLTNQRYLQALMNVSQDDVNDNENEEDVAEDDEKPKSDTSADNDGATLPPARNDKAPELRSQSAQVSAEIMEKFKLPTSLIVKKMSAPKETAMPITTETPIKATFVKQNFTEANASQTQIETEIPKATSVDEVEKNKIDPPTSASTRLRQRKASIDIVDREAIVPRTPHSNLDKNSKVINRSARKNQVLSRMRNIKKQIFKAIAVGNDVGAKVNKQNALKVMADSGEITRKSLVPSPKINIEKVEVLPNLNLQSNNKPQEPLATEVLRLTRSSAENASASKTLNLKIKQEMLTPQAAASKRRLSASELKTIKKEETATPRVLSKRRQSSDKAASSSAFTNFKKPKIELATYGKSALLPKSPPAEQAAQKSPTAATVEATHTKPTNSAVGIVKHDLKKSLNDKNIESILNETTSEGSLPETTEVTRDDIGAANDTNEMQLRYAADDSSESQTIDSLLEQVVNESTSSTDKQSVDENEIKSNEIEANKSQSDEVKQTAELSALDQEDLKLLEQVGLRILKVSEDKLPLEQYESNHVRARQFALIYEQCSFIWHSRANELKVTDKLNQAFAQLTQSTNEAFGLQLTAKDLKRLSNLLIIWYSTQCNSKLLHKRTATTRVEEYFRLFSFIPKTTRRTLICEYCDEHYSQMKYLSHRFEHTGTVPYHCRHCQRGFMRAAPLRVHELTCRGKCKDCSLKFSTTEELEAHRRSEHQFKCERCGAESSSLRLHKMHQRECGSEYELHRCGVCRATFHSAPALYVHSQQHLQRVHKCRTCQRVFAADQDLKRHMLLCCKREEQSATPRPSKAKRPNN